LAQAVHALCTYSLIYALLCRRSPRRYFCGLARPMTTAFGTASSAATLATTIQACLQLGVSESVARFVLPIGATLNMDGSALERPITVLWIAHVSGVPLDGARQLLVAVTSALLSIGASPIPSAGVSTLIVMIEQAGVPLTPPVLLATSACLAVEWLFDRVRTTVNVTGDAVGAAVVDAIIERRRDRTADTPAHVANGACSLPSGRVVHDAAGKRTMAGAARLEQSVLCGVVTSALPSRGASCGAKGPKGHTTSTEFAPQSPLTEQAPAAKVTEGPVPGEGGGGAA